MAGPDLGNAVHRRGRRAAASHLDIHPPEIARERHDVATGIDRADGPPRFREPVQHSLSGAQRKAGGDQPARKIDRPVERAGPVQQQDQPLSGR